MAEIKIDFSGPIGVGKTTLRSFLVGELEKIGVTVFQSTDPDKDTLRIKGDQIPILRKYMWGIS